MAGSYLPGADTEFSAWFEQFAKTFGDNATFLGFTVDQVAALTGLLSDWNDAYGNHVSAQNAAKGATAYKDNTREAITEVLRNYVKQIQANPKTTDDMRANFGITVPTGNKRPTPVPIDAPDIDTDWSKRGQVTVHVGITPGNERLNKFPGYAQFALIQFRLGAGNWQLAGLVSSSPFVHVVGNTQPETIEYRACYVNSLGEQGPWSEVDNAYVANAA